MKDAVTRHGDAIFEGHPPSEWMVMWAEARDELTAEQHARIERHLDVCARCEEEIVMLQQVSGLTAAPDPGAAGAAGRAERAGGWASSGGASSAATFAPGSGDTRARRQEAPTGWFERLLGWIHGPAAVPAFALSLLLLVPAWIGIRGPGEGAIPGGQAPGGGAGGPGEPGEAARPPATMSAPLSGLRAPTVLRADVERGEIVRVEGAEAASLLFTVPPRASGPRPVAVSLLRADEVVARVERVAPFDEFGAYLVVLRTADLPIGRYTLEAEDAGTVTRFDFALD